ncbi:aminoglycoside phosphotransferase family protein [Micromonospora zingiberis]|uniref:Aminoglycoside phosphotransferase family protein n=1 Tax=Micromonospora zingiberis TaxID=2053011 RepID=A0A4R0G9R3_9ACTN|nr:phosphotransferase [Micromonospora zingiberis]TCB92693.1 aminoglycoside phosphotransferase family protein [Micromonospora zingiberis]
MTAAAVPHTGWDDPHWQAAALDWVTEALARTGRRVTGPVEPRIRPWSLVWRVPTDAGAVWFKANSPGTRYEAGLLATLARLTPGRVLDPIAVDLDRGWAVLPDGGATLREVAGGESDPSRWERVLPEYAELQRVTVAHVDELLALGVPDHRPEVLPELFAQLLDDRAALLIGTPDGLTTETYDRLRGLLPAYAERCRWLAGSGVAPSIQHDDLHDGNVFVASTGHRFFDWGDASVAHPFGTLLVTLRSIAYTTGRASTDPALVRLRDAYLEPWTDRFERDALRRMAGVAAWVTVVSRSLSWRRALATADPTRAEYAAAVPGWLEELLADEPD